VPGCVQPVCTAKPVPFMSNIAAALLSPVRLTPFARVLRMAEANERDLFGELKNRPVLLDRRTGRVGETRGFERAAADENAVNRRITGMEGTTLQMEGMSRPFP